MVKQKYAIVIADEIYFATPSTKLQNITLQHTEAMEYVLYLIISQYISQTYKHKCMVNMVMYVNIY